MKAILYFFCLFSLLLEGCFLFPDSKPIGGNDTTKVPTSFPAFTPTFAWVQPTRGVAMDVFPFGDIISRGFQTINDEHSPVLQIFSADGTILRARTSNGGNALIRELFADTEQGGGYRTIELYNLPPTNQYKQSISAVFDGSGFNTIPYTRYNTAFGGPDTDPNPWAGYVEVVGPNIARGPRQDKQGTAASQPGYQYRPSSWLVGTFTDQFSANGNENLCPTFGKADCFVIRSNDQSGIPFLKPVQHQWGGVENDLAYDVASDTTGNATIFLRAGTDFAITSATQSLVRMKVGYNIVRLDTNGFLTETFPVTLEATGELTDTQIAIGKNGAVYILAKDRNRKQYFLARATRSGTSWIRYFPTSVADLNRNYPTNRTVRMGLVVDSKDCAYVTGNFYGTVDWGGVSLTASGEMTEGVVAKYSPTNTCLGAFSFGSGFGATIRLSPQEDAVYINGWAAGSIMGVEIPNYDEPRNGVQRPGAFLLKLKL